MNFIVMLLLLVMACRHQVKEELKADSTSTENTAETYDAETTRTRQQDPTQVDTKTTIEESAVIVEDPDGGVQVARVGRKPLQFPKGSWVLGTVPLTSTTVDQTKRVGGTYSTENTAEKTDVDTNVRKLLHLEDKKVETSEFLNSWKFYLMLAGIVLVVLGAAFVYLKFMRKVSWL